MDRVGGVYGGRGDLGEVVEIGACYRKLNFGIPVSACIKLQTLEFQSLLAISLCSLSRIPRSTMLLSH